MTAKKPILPKDAPPATPLHPGGVPAPTEHTVDGITEIGDGR